VKPDARGITTIVRDTLRASAAVVAETRRRRSMQRIVRPERFWAFGAGSIIEPPLRAAHPEYVEVGSDVRIRPNAWLSVVGTQASPGAPLLSIGDRAMLGADLIVACVGRVEIGPDVLASDRVFIGDTYHEYHDVEQPISAQGFAAPRPVRIEAGAFIGVGAIVLPGVTIGENAYIGAGAVVTDDVPARCVAVGNPARVVSRWDATAGEWQRVSSIAATTP
jgi:acetyltransferase-like isoleucine patch superfamily enzyme